MAKRSIGADDLGAFGEAHFERLCAAAGLVANKSGRDKMGWDYFVEQAPDELGPALDKRRPFPLCRIQVKTVWKRDGARVSLKLSAAERIAKPEDPAFIVAFEAEDAADDVEIVSASLIHVIGDDLSRVLKRLRAAGVDLKKKSLNEQDITFQINSGTPFSTGKEFRAALGAAIGRDSDNYRDAKRAALANLGYDGPRYSVQVALTAEDPDHLYEALLGRRPIEVRGTNAVDRRFDIEVPSGHTWEVGPGERLMATFKPIPQGDCSIVARGEGGETVGFNGTFSTLPLPNVPQAEERLVFSTPTFELEARGSGRIALHIGGERTEANRLPIADWRALFRLVRLVNAGPMEFEILERKTGARFEIPLARAAEGTHFSTGSQVLGLLTRIEDLWAQAGARVPDFTQQELADIGEVVDAVHRFWKGDLLENLDFPLAGSVSAEATELVLIRVMSVELAGSHVAVADRLVMTNGSGGADFTQRNRNVVKVEDIGMAEDAVTEFAKRVMEKVGAHGIMTLASV